MSRASLLWPLVVCASFVGCKATGDGTGEGFSEAKAVPDSVPEIEAPGHFELVVDQESADDATLEVHWTPSLRSSHYVITVASGSDCIYADGESNPVFDAYELTTTSVELPPLPVGNFVVCAVAFTAKGVSTEADNSGFKVVVAE